MDVHLNKPAPTVILQLDLYEAKVLLTHVTSKRYRALPGSNSDRVLESFQHALRPVLRDAGVTLP